MDAAKVFHGFYFLDVFHQGLPRVFVVIEPVAEEIIGK